eukprot:TRINITY_DN33088_c0_g1_i1.p1 TRINITY_DN33088_c0_g1~~TRINITY_DN33088_c0_g1_i1.p1  ORF type:complete len:349 (-),score=25.90 TRINITY_DN33088_c0_g1_i1:358-1404(-)
MLGVMYIRGNGLPKSTEKAAMLFNLAGCLGEKRAQLNLGICLTEGFGVLQDKVAAAHWLRLAAAQDEGVAFVHLGMMAEAGCLGSEGMDDALGYYYAGAGLRDVHAFCRLGVYYFNKGSCDGSGRTAAKYLFLALHWWARWESEFDATQPLQLSGRVSRWNPATAMGWYGKCFDKGKGVVQDYSRAAYWYRFSLSAGSVEMQANMGCLYEMGYGVPQDYKKARDYYRLAAERLEPDALVKLGILNEKGKGGPHDYAFAFELYSAAALLECPRAIMHLGHCYQRGRGVAKDRKKAKMLYAQSDRLRQQRGELPQGWLSKFWSRTWGFPTPWRLADLKQLRHGVLATSPL